MNVLGCASLPLQFGSETLQTPIAVVQGVGYELLLGTDFLRRHRCQIDFAGGVFRVNGSRVPIRETKHKPVVCRLYLNENLIIPANHERTVSARIRRTATQNSGVLGVAEPDEKLKSDERPMLARSVCLIQQGNTLPVHFANVTDSELRLRKGAVIGWFRPSDPAQEVLVASIEEQASVLRPSCDPWDPEAALNQHGSKQLTGADKASFLRLVNRYADVFAESTARLGTTDIVQHEIETTGTAVKQPPRRLPPHWRGEVDRQIDELLATKMIEPTQSPWSSPVVCVRKKNGELRLCVDYRELNQRTVKDAIAIPRVDDALEALGGAAVFSTLDLCSGYWQVKVKREDQEKTAFVIPHRGQFAFKVLPFGLTNAPATFTRLMNMVLHDLLWKMALVYIDDIIIWSRTVSEHLTNLEAVFQRLRAANLRLKPSKCRFLADEVKFLGHVVSKDGIDVDPEKIKEVRDWSIPRNAKDLQSFLGLAGYYRNFIPEFSIVAAPLFDLTKKDKPFSWREEHDEAFKKLKEELTGCRVMAYPNFDPTAGEFILDTDGSTRQGLGAVLSQVQEDGSERVIAYGSRRLQGAEFNYCTTRIELLALVTFAERFRYYLLGRRFRVRTDHASLQWLRSMRQPEGQLARWMERLAPFDFAVEHRPGARHQNADALSRKPPRRHPEMDNCPSCRTDDLPGVRVTTLLGLLSRDELAAAQAVDNDIAPVYQSMHAGRANEEPPRGASPTTRAIWAQKPRLEIVDNTLVIKDLGRHPPRAVLRRN
ncbi:hypothetical protein BOX15_Mlig001877g1 [Macrostomum lignano]|uniref:RNA-directed DNA polymerase n=2 Tax=Macrostomum lignano TaxID=282301 RepID=A0A267DW99_9PLAT|nr:hypothetical protein BOX15_Mlig001877g1 [Macrostomum lignano]